VAESWSATFKQKPIGTRPWPTLAGLRVAMFDYVEGWSHTRRVHSTLGDKSPAAYELMVHNNTGAKAA
jgi:putative transposase